MAVQQHKWTPSPALPNLITQGRILVPYISIMFPITLSSCFFKSFMELLQSFNSDFSVAVSFLSSKKPFWNCAHSTFEVRFLSLLLITQYSLYSSCDKADKLILMLHEGGEGHITVAWFAWMYYWPSTEGPVKFCGHSINSMSISAHFLPLLSFIE